VQHLVLQCCASPTVEQPSFSISPDFLCLHRYWYPATSRWIRSTVGQLVEPALVPTTSSATPTAFVTLDATPLQCHRRASAAPFRALTLCAERATLSCPCLTCAVEGGAGNRAGTAATQSSNSLAATRIATGLMGIARASERRWSRHCESPLPPTSPRTATATAAARAQGQLRRRLQLLQSCGANPSRTPQA